MVPGGKFARSDADSVRLPVPMPASAHTEEKAAKLEAPLAPLADTNKVERIPPLTLIRPGSTPENKQQDFTQPSVWNDSVAVETQKEQEQAMEERTPSQESYFTMDAEGSFGGSRWVIPLSRRTSLVYGLGFKHLFFQAGNRVEERNSLPMPVLEAPLELRYYLLPKENRFSAFLYTQVKGSFTGSSPGLGFEAGGAAQYRLWKTSRGASYFFVRMPVYQRNLLAPRLPGRTYPYVLPPR